MKTQEKRKISLKMGRRLIGKGAPEVKSSKETSARDDEISSSQRSTEEGPRNARKWGNTRRGL